MFKLSAIESKALPTEPHAQRPRLLFSPCQRRYLENMSSSAFSDTCLGLSIDTRDEILSVSPTLVLPWLPDGVLPSQQLYYEPARHALFLLWIFPSPYYHSFSCLFPQQFGKLASSVPWAQSTTKNLGCLGRGIIYRIL